MGKSRRKFLCVDCGVDTGKIHEHYFVHTHIWLKVMPTTRGMLCIEHIEKRLGRRLTVLDFTNATINNPRFEPKSQRLMERLTAHVEKKKLLRGQVFYRNIFSCGGGDPILTVTELLIL